jgi:hypothetical protein
MEAIRKIMTVRDNTIKITLPDTYNDKEIELIILPVNDPMQVQEPVVNYEKLYGSLKSGLTVEEIDRQLKALRNEWNRDIS